MPSSITCTAVLDVRRASAEHLAKPLRGQRERLGTRTGTSAPGVFRQAVLVLRWFVDDTRPARIARGNGISVPTAFRYLHEGLTVLSAHAPDLSTTLERATVAGHTHLNLDGTVIRTDRVAAAGPNKADLWWSGSTSITERTRRRWPSCGRWRNRPGPPGPRPREASAFRGARSPCGLPRVC